MRFILLALILFCSPAWAAIDLEDTGVAANEPFLSQADGLSTDLNGANQQISISAWIRPENDTAANRQIVTKYDINAVGRSYRLAVTATDAIEFRLSSNGSTSTVATSTSTISDGVSYQVGGTSDDVNIQVYFNGVADGAAVGYTAGIFNSPTLFMIGAQMNGQPTVSATAFDGTIDDVCVWNTAITAADMATIYNSKQKGMCSQIKPANLVLYCALDQCAEGTSCTADLNCYPGSPVSDTNTVTGASQRVLSYPPQGVQIS